ncbi:MAG: radical SAM protein [Clostridium baratii]|uniref:Radical SAM superfamily protein n=1 Tax=Clostridium baratii str. Sullivan TaxID=1415775 RepID=A0A0A7FWZ8_9CLOT|nr:radical SAM protein [Clostridium baratii]AIY83316.1 radical SAM superfamily protein [Clostridium baratii str. Sullivan]MBS6006721.1 radical SAM protein [Clostridium baratii]MDU1053606.1 radical SAM protein [Clostridium baratii]MDU4910350.1 radical SAM protein [Clostridium baratii]CUO99524.1 radical SAM domain-containing protein [Clostridium baratii]
MSKSHYIIPIFVPHEGCPHNCVFCNQDRITGVKDKVDGEKVENIINEYYETIENKDATIEVSFFGGTFTAIREEKQRELLKVAKKYKDLGIVEKIRMSTRPDYINDYILTYLKEYDVDIIELGIQSLDDEVLVAAGRGHTAEDVKNASKLIKKYGITLGHQLMPGLPKSTEEKDIKSAIDSLSMEPELLRIYPSLVIKDTPMEIMYNRGEYTPYTLEKAVDVSKKIFTMFNNKGVNVIRIGLQPTETINTGKDIIAGPFHPAFRELVQGSLIADSIRENANSKSFELLINNKDLSKLYANKKIYFNKLKSEGYDIKVIVTDEVSRGKLILKEDKEKEILI